MNCFFDTSALAKLFQKEEGSNVVEELINAPVNDIWILDLTRIELLSSFYRRYRQKDISEKELEIILNAFDEHSWNSTRNSWVLLFYLKQNNS